MSVLVTHAHNRLAYYATRCLARHDIKVTCASEFPLATTFFSRYCTNHFTYPSPWTNPEKFVDKVIEEIEKREIEVLMPVHREGYVLAKYKDQLDRKVKFPYTTYQNIDLVNDKKTMAEIARKIGVKTPRTIAPNNLDQVEQEKSDLQYPAIIKLRRSHGGIGISKVDRPSQLPNAYLKTINKFNLTQQNNYPIIQEHIQGKRISPALLFNYGKLKAKFSTYLPQRTKNPFQYDAHTRYYRIGQENPETIKALHKFGKHLKWHGTIHGSFIQQEDTEEIYLVDINPRFWGGLGSAIMWGVEFPYLLYQIATNGDVKPVLDFTKGQEARYLWGDLHYLPNCLRNGEWKQAWEILTCKAPLDFWDPNDPIPFFTIPIYTMTQLIRTGTILPLIEKY